MEKMFLVIDPDSNYYLKELEYIMAGNAPNFDASILWINKNEGESKLFYNTQIVSFPEALTILWVCIERKDTNGIFMVYEWFEWMNIEAKANEIYLDKYDRLIDKANDIAYKGLQLESHQVQTVEAIKIFIRSFVTKGVFEGVQRVRKVSKMPEFSKASHQIEGSKGTVYFFPDGSTFIYLKGGEKYKLTVSPAKRR